MWTSRSDELPNGDGIRFALDRNAEPATFADVVTAWRTDAAFRGGFNTLLAGVPYSAFRWETPGVTSASATRAFEFVALNDPALARRPDPDAFAEHFRGADSAVLAFPNLRGDAVMVVPCPQADSAAYGHLAAFVRHAPEPQRDALWEAVGGAMARRIGKNPVWLSTAGAGVSWLHVRLDDRPKYYGHEPYRLWPA